MTPTPGAEWAAVLALGGASVAFLPSLPRGREWARILVVTIGLAFAVRYLAWRFEVTVLPADPWTMVGAWVWGVFLVEVIAILNAAIAYVMLTKTTDHTPAADAHEARLRATPAADLPHVDVFLCTYNEGLEVVEGPIVAAANLDYPNFTVWVLDDGRREWLRELCEAKGVRYMTHPDNFHAKAGNINHALGRTGGELFAVLDADFAPRRDFLLRTVGFFDDPTVAIVQTPHHFINADIYEMNLGLGDQSPNEQRLFFDVVQASRDGWDCAFCCGSASVQRRSALEGIGGIPVESVTEDILSSLILLRRGYVTRFLNEPLAFGLSPESVAGMFVQRQRWCRGGLQLLFLRDGVLGSGLTLRQRLFFFPLDWLVQTPVRLFSVLVPIVYLWTGLPPLVHARVDELIAYQLPALIAMTMPMVWISGGRYLPLISTGFSLLLSFRLVPTILSTLIKPFGVPFRVTPKGMGAGQGVDGFARGSAMILLLLTLIGVLINAHPEWSVIADPTHRAAAAIFAGVNALTLILAMLAGRDRRRPRQAERFSAGGPILCELDDGARVIATLRDVSVGGASISWPEGRPIPNAMELNLPDGRTIRAEVVRRDNHRLGLSFPVDDPDDHDRVLLWIYGIGVGAMRAPLSIAHLSRRLLARCLR